ncbi:hypothetical protein [Catenovulum agarivorans]|uniref:hypothetical protein n=1 Tax=Catenovulum agarivorans TaxID=1172192 RepID=UPI0003031DF4|nr:hypothetical protein [Catenovulum agarivorans]
MSLKINSLLYLLFSFAFISVLGKSLNLPFWGTHANKIDFLILIFFLAISIPFIYKLKQSSSVKRVTWPFIAYLLISFVSSFRELSLFSVGQALLNLKFPLMIVFVYMLDFEKFNLASFQKLLMRMMAVNLLFIALEILFPNIHKSIFNGAISDTIIQGTNLVRFTGYFVHPAAMGVFSSVCLLWGAAYLISGYNNRHSYLLVLFSLTSLLFSGQRLELAACIMIVSWVLIVKYTNPMFVRTVFIAAVLWGGVTMVVQMNSVNDFSNQLIDEGHARVVLYAGSISLANEYFPLGSGLGTFGSSMSLSNKNSMYHHLGISDYWWFEGASYLTDTHWAMIVGESGYFGMLAYLAFLIVQFKICYRNYRQLSDYNYVPILGCMLVCFGFVSSLATPIYAGTLLPILCISLVVAANLKLSDSIVATTNTRVFQLSKTKSYHSQGKFNVAHKT